MKLSDSIQNLKGIGEKTSTLFGKVGVFSLWDLLLYIPRDFVINPEIRTASSLLEAKEGELAAVRLTVQGVPSLIHVRRLSILNAFGSDETGSVKLSWYNQPYLKKTLQPGSTRVFLGKVKFNRGTVSLEHPKMFRLDEYEKQKGILHPVYPLTHGLTSKGIEKAVKGAFDAVTPISDFLTKEELDKLDLQDLETSLRTVHSPASPERMTKARKRLAFNEYLSFLLSIRRMKTENAASHNDFHMTEADETNKLIGSLPYKLTGAQTRAFQDVINDVGGERAMNRLVQGDVGSGKTIVALLAMLTAAANGYQSAMMAPTEVLASQHAEKIRGLFEEYGINYDVELLTGSLTAKEKREAKKRIESGEARIVIGTHALIQEDVVFQNLALVVTDEQHRFGVNQRQVLADKTINKKVPHVLVMSATPIPRTLAIILYGDLDISVMDELPAARLPIKNAVVGIEYRKKAYNFILKQVQEGHQAYVICPQVEESEMVEGENVTDYSAKLKEIYGDTVRVAMLHGKMKPKEKNEIMRQFSEHEIDVLVSTTVIEVGVDVPNSTVMMIEDAQKFGLAALHQIRGRVGRGKAQSYCIFVNTAGGEEDNKRLKVLSSTNDGFKIASEDLKLRGPGDLFGIRQSGVMDFKIADIYNDADMLKAASAFVHDISKEAEERLMVYEADTGRITL